MNSPGNLPQIRADTGQTRYSVGDLLLDRAQFAWQGRLGGAQREAQRNKSLLGTCFCGSIPTVTILMSSRFAIADDGDSGEGRSKPRKALRSRRSRGWLNQWGNPPMPSAGGDMPGMPGRGDMPGMSGGAGMMSEQDMTALQNAEGVEASRLFLTQMIAQHEGAITMAQTEINDGQYPEAVALARSMVTSQQQEIDTMKAILASL